jgi:hypothetical protein
MNIELAEGQQALVRLWRIERPTFNVGRSVLDVGRSSFNAVFLQEIQ